MWTAGHRAALLVTALLAVLVTWPLVADPLTAPVGHPGNDVWNHLWGYWWVKEELLAGRLPLRTDLMTWPASSRLFFIDTFGAVLTLPVQLLGGVVLAYNTVIFVTTWLAGYATWALARHVTGEVRGPGIATDTAALVAAAAWMSSPHLVAQTHNGITETLFAAGLPAAALALLRLYAHPGPLRAALAAAAVAVCVIANWYYGLFAVLAGGVLLLGHVFTRRERTDWRRLVPHLGAAAAAAVLVVAPVLVAFASTLDGEDAVVQRDPDFVWRSLVDHNMTDVVSGFHPGKFYSPDLKALHGEDLLIVTYLGWALLGLAVAGLATMRRWRDRLPWLAWIGVFYLLMLGPYLYVDGAYVTLADRKIPLPFLALFELVPVFSRISHPFRFVMPVQLGLALLAARALVGLPGWARALAATGLLVEHLLLSPAPWPLARSDARMPEHVAVLAGDPAPGGVLDLPVTVPNLERAVYLYWQTAHGRASPYQLNEPLPGVLRRSHLVQLLLVAEGGRVDSLPPVLPTLDLVASGRALAALGARYIVLHETLYPPDRRALAIALLRTTFGPETVTTDDGRRIWRLEPSP